MNDAFGQRRVILHADMDAFYASVEQRDHPELKGQPVIIGAQSPRGVVSAASYEARKFGVRSAMPGFEARRLCPHGVFLGGDMEKYARVSRQIHEIFNEFTEQIEPLALDEAFLDITGSRNLLGPAEQIGADLKRRVREVTGLAVSVGIATNKLVAKVACSRGKPDGLFLVPPGQEAALLAPLPVRALFGVGPKTAEKLQASGFSFIGDLAQAPLTALSSVFGKHAEAMRDRAQGLDERPVMADRLAKSIGEESTFPSDVTSREVLESALVAHAETVAARARRAGFFGRTVTVKVKFARRTGPRPAPIAHHELFPQKTKQARLDEPTAEGGVIAARARTLLAALDPREPVRLIGVSLSELSEERGPEQLGLFTSAPPRASNKDRSARLGAALDAINEKFGKGAIGSAARSPDKATASNRIKTGEPGGLKK